MQYAIISTRLRLIRPGDTKAWPYSIDPSRVLVIFLPWLNAKEKHLSKYVQLYLDIGLDVLCFKSQIGDFLWPPTSFAVIQELSEVLKQCKHYDHYLFHAMSVGSFNLGTFHMLATNVQEVAELNNKVCGIVYDSLVVGAWKGSAFEKSGDDNIDNKQSIDMIIRGLANSISQSKIVLSLVSIVSKTYFSLTKKHTLDYYDKLYDMSRNSPCKVPMLVLTSKNDPMCDTDVLTYLTEAWKSHGVPVTLHTWDESGHTRHLAFHRNDYIFLLRKFLDEIFGGIDKDKEISSRL